MKELLPYIYLGFLASLVAILAVQLLLFVVARFIRALGGEPSALFSWPVDRFVEIADGNDRSSVGFYIYSVWANLAVASAVLTFFL